MKKAVAVVAGICLSASVALAFPGMMKGRGRGARGFLEIMREMRLMRTYCTQVNPSSPSCKERQKTIEEFREKMATLRQKIKAEMKQYCEKHKDDAFCKELRREPAPRPAPKGKK